MKYSFQLSDMNYIFIKYILYILDLLLLLYNINCSIDDYHEHILGRNHLGNTSYFNVYQIIIINVFNIYIFINFIFLFFLIPIFSVSDLFDQYIERLVKDYTTESHPQFVQQVQSFI